MAWTTQDQLGGCDDGAIADGQQRPAGSSRGKGQGRARVQNPNLQVSAGEHEDRRIFPRAAAHATVSSGAVSTAQNARRSSGPQFERGTDCLEIRICCNIGKQLGLCRARRAGKAKRHTYGVRRKRKKSGSELKAESRSTPRESEAAGHASSHASADKKVLQARAPRDRRRGKKGFGRPCREPCTHMGLVVHICTEPASAQSQSQSLTHTLTLTGTGTLTHRIGTTEQTLAGTDNLELLRALRDGRDCFGSGVGSQGPLSPIGREKEETMRMIGGVDLRCKLSSPRC
jgi:hypothetical protein